MIGTKGFWIDDNEYCEIVGVIDKGVGLYEFHAIDSDSNNPDWIGFIDDFFEEDLEE